jgi:hypothetical protein
MISRLKDLLDLQEAMANLATIAEIDMNHPPRLGIVRGKTLVTDEEEFPMGTIQWLSEEKEGPVLEVLDKTYWAIHQHLQSLYENPETDWESEKVRAGVAATMSLVGESAAKMNRYLAFRMGKPNLAKIETREEYKALQQFYLFRLSGKFPGGIEGDQAWSEEWLENAEAPPSIATGLKDFETVRRDKEYELFYIRNEEGNPYFSTELLRNIKLTVDMQSGADTFEEDPLLKVRTMHDRDLQASANQILGDCAEQIEDYFKIVRKLEKCDLANELNKAMVALLLSANPRNLLQNSTGKSSLQYFNDFLMFFRSAMKSVEYQKWIAYPPDPSDRIASLLLKLTHALCYSFFFRVGGVRQEAIGLIHRMMRKGEESLKAKKKQLPKGESFWNQFLMDDERLRTLLTQFPNGPLFKILDLIREQEEEEAIVPFDPIGQDNLPSRLYQVAWGKKRIDVIRCPSPIRQAAINKAEIVDEFRGFLRFLGTRGQKHLIVNLNDRTSWREFVRSSSIENLQKNAEFSHQLFCLTLPKDTDFYYQNNEYVNLHHAEDFMAALVEQVASGEECGYFFPASWKKEEIVQFTKAIIPLIHAHFFHKKAELTRRNREDFVEIFYQFLILKAIEHFAPDSMSFTCKDAIDTGAAEVGTFYGLLKLLGEGLERREERDFLLWLFYTPALFIRERGIDSERLNRALSSLERCDTEIAAYRDRILKGFSEHFEPKFFKELQVIHL